MNETIEQNLERFLTLLKESQQVKDLESLQKEIMKDKDFLKKIEKLHTLEKYDPAYKETKKELFQNEQYKKYLEINQELTYWTYEISAKLKECTRDDQNENH